MSPARSNNVRPPDVTGYRFVEFLASGGYADVFLFEQEFPRQRVAVKALRHIDPMDSAFINEANRLAGLSDHPNIVRIQNANVSNDGRAFMVMEYCPPPHLGARSRPNGLPIEEALRVGVKIAGAVEAAHRSGLLHRDIKPMNVLLRANGEPVLIDFGIAGERQGDHLEEGAGISIPYAAPEVALEDAPGDELSDVYSLGATVYALVAGRSPYEVAGGDNSAAGLLSRMRTGDTPPTRRQDAPEALEHLFSFAMARRPDDRPQSAAAFAQAIQQIERNLGYRATEFFAGASERTYDPPPRDASDADGTRAQVQVVSPEPKLDLVQPLRSAAVSRPVPTTTSDAVEAPDAATGSRAASYTTGFEAATRARQHEAPDVVVVEPPASRSVPTLWLVIAATIIGLVTIAFVLSSTVGGGTRDNDGTVPTTVGPDVDQPSAPDPVVSVSAVRTANGIAVSWTPGQDPGDIFSVEIKDHPGYDKTVEDTNVVIGSPPAGKVCVLVRAGADGSSYSSAREACTE